MAENTPLARAALALEDAMRHEVSGLPAKIYQDAAKRMLQAIREPSEGMIESGAYEDRKHNADDFGNPPVSEMWAAMIAAALEEG